MSERIKKVQSGLQRAKRTRAGLHGTSDRPRLSVTVSNKHISAQIINDDEHVTITAVSSVSAKKTGTMTEKAATVGTAIAKAAKAKKVTKVVFDRGAKQYHGRIKALADAARAEGLEF